MARTTGTSGKLLSPSSSAKGAKKVAKAATVDPAFAEAWNGLEKDERRQIRRLVRIGRPQESVAEAELAVGFAAYQRTRPWYRFFWLWIVPLVVAGLIAGASLHPLVIGMVAGAAVVAIMARRNFKRAAKVNESLLGSSAVPAAA